MILRSALSRPLARLTVVTMVLSGLVVGAFVAPAASAAPGPVAARPTTAVTADALPTVQVNGVVWSQAVVGTTVYAGGSFTNARPAGAAPGVNTTARSNLLAYTLSSGVLVSAFAPTFDGQVQAVAASADGSVLYVGGQFTHVNGGTRNRLVAISSSTGAVISSFTANLDAQVKAIVVTNNTVYVGGQFTVAGGQPRSRLAAFNASNGALTSWNPGADSTVNAMVMTPDSSMLVVGGRFQNLGGGAAYGLGAVHPTTGALQPWAANQKVRNAGVNSAITSLSTAGSAVYGTGYVFGTGGNFEGTFSASSSGAINWLEDCHGDTYSAFASGTTVYTVSHAHYCGNVGGFYQSDPWSTNQKHALAFTTNATGTLNGDPLGYPNWAGNPSPSMVTWFPDMTNGTYTGQNQAAWTVTGNSQYVVMGGEFPTVNGVGQQGLVRFAVNPPAAKQGPMITGSKFMPNLVQTGANSVKVSFGANWDRDGKSLTYRVVRNSKKTEPVKTIVADSTFWNRPRLGFTDNVPAAGSYAYRLYVTDGSGNEVAGDTATITTQASGPALSDYAQAVTSQGPRPT